MTTKIEWTERTWNPIAGCTRISEGCKHCYAERMARRLAAMGAAKYQGLLDDHGRWNGQINMGDDHDFLAPLLRKKPTTWFVNSMSDLFHEGVSFDTIDRVFAVMALCPQHTFQVLTKRSARMREYFTQQVPDRGGYAAEIADASFLCAIEVPSGAHIIEQPVGPIMPDGTPEFGHRRFVHPLPLPNVWLGVSVENQRAADERIPDLLECPAAVRFLSCEPLIGEVSIHPYLMKFLHWVICGGESGPGARPMHPDWARGLRDQCVAAGVPYFFKQFGEWGPMDSIHEDSEMHEWPGPILNGVELASLRPAVYRVGKKLAGRMLDGREWNEMPEVLAR